MNESPVFMSLTTGNKAKLKNGEWVECNEKIDGYCPWHKPVKLSYGAWIDFAEAQIKAGNKQKQCPICKRYLFPCEWGDKDYIPEPPGN
jgi:hypothetical protein